MLKQKIRESQIALLKRQSPDEKIKRELLIYHFLFNSSLINEATNIAITVSMDFEINTQPVIEYCLKQHKKVFIPKTLSNRKMDFVEYQPEYLVQTKFGVLEPSQGRVIEPKQIDLIFVPGLIFSISDGARIGFGGGYFDRYLKLTEAKKIAIVGDNQVVDNANWKSDKFDVNVNHIITDSGILR